MIRAMGTIRTILALCLVASVPGVALAGSRGLHGAWTASTSEERPELLNVSMQMAGHEHSGSRFARRDFEGLTDAQIQSASSVPVQFELRREAGTLAFEGTFRDGEGAGQFTFQPNMEFPGALRRLGVALEGKQEDEAHELLKLAMFDVSSKFVESMQAVGYSVPLEKYVAFRIFDVNPAYVREMADVGFAHLSADKLVETRIHGATPDYIREQRAAGADLSLDQYIESRIFQITPEFRAEMKNAGYPNLDRDVLLQFRIHGVTPEYIEELRKLGYAHIPAQKLVEMRIHDVSPEFIRRLAAAGYHQVPIDKMVQMRIFDIKPEMLKALDDASD